MPDEKRKRWVVFDPEEPPEFFATAGEAKNHAEGILQEYRERAVDGWDEEVTVIEWGEYIVHEEVQETSRTPADEGCEFDDYLEYGLVPVTPRRSEGEGE